MLKLPLISISRGDVTFNDNLFVRKDQNNFPSIVITKRIATSQFNNSERVAFNTKYQVAGGRYKSEEAVYETHEIPYPDFIDLTYTINFWANYVSHVNKFHEKIITEKKTFGRTYNLGSGYNHSVNEIYEIIDSILETGIEPMYNDDLLGEALLPGRITLHPPKNEKRN